MLDTLRRIVQEVNSARDLDQVLGIIVGRVKQSMCVEVCSIYLTDLTQQQYILMATDGLNQESVGLVRMGFYEGLVGQVGKREEPVNLDNATEHPSYRYFPETGEEQYPSFLGVPIIHHRKVLGILIVQGRKTSKFSENDEAFLITIASQLAGAIAHAEASGGINKLTSNNFEFQTSPTSEAGDCGGSSPGS